MMKKFKFNHNLDVPCRERMRAVCAGKLFATCSPCALRRDVGVGGRWLRYKSCINPDAPGTSLYLRTTIVCQK